MDPDRETHVTGGQYFEARPAVASAPSRVRLDLPDLSLVLDTDRGVFSADAVDVGTGILLREGGAPAPSGTLVDVGCGYGPIALTLASRSPEASVLAVDVNERARALCHANAERAGLDNVTVVSPDDVADDLAVDEIWSNPPIRIGKPALHALLDGWLARLVPGGRAVLVVQKHLGADSLAARLTSVGWSVERLASRRAFRILEVRRA
jgi:16S rRNA (guanine1207-N2)-methyltransferase